MVAGSGTTIIDFRFDYYVTFCRRYLGDVLLLFLIIFAFYLV